MAIPATPQNFIVQQGNGEVFVSWNISVGATQYSLQRSTDGGVSYSVVATPSVTHYLDTSVTIQTSYLYQVAASSGSGYSAYTNPIQIVPTLTGEMTLGEMRERAQMRADMQNSQFISTVEWNYYLNQSALELYDLLITCYEDYYVADRLLITTDGSEAYDLPNGQNYNGADALYKLYGVDLGLDSSMNAFVTLKKFDFISRNRYVYPQLTTNLLGLYTLQYRLVGGKIRFIPIPSGAQMIGLWYFPRLQTLLQDTDVLDGISGWNEYVIVDAARKARQKEESSTEELMNEKMMLKARIESSAMNRDAGQPDTISNSRSRSEAWGFYGGPGMDGNYGGY